MKVREGKKEEIEWVLKQKLFDYVPQSECSERHGRPYSLKWVLKNKGEKVRARLVVREIKKAKSEYEKLEPSDVFSAMPPVESLKALVGHVMTGASAHFYGVCERDVHVEPLAELHTERKMQATHGRSCGVNTFATMALSLVQAILHCTDQSL